MNRISRRSLARYAAQQIIDGQKPVKLAKQLAGVLREDGGSHNIHLLISDIYYELESSGHLAVAKLTTAREITKSLEDEFVKCVKKSAGASSVIIEKSVDPSLIGGYRLETSTTAWDTTIKKKLMQLKEAF